jgi:hypothetical protein
MSSLMGASKCPLQVRLVNHFSIPMQAVDGALCRDRHDFANDRPRKSLEPLVDSQVLGGAGGDMHRLIAGLLALFALMPAEAAALRAGDLASTATALNWINNYRKSPAPKDVPALMRGLSRLGAFNHPERSGVYIGFLAGVLADNPDKTEWLVSQTLKMDKQDRWAVVRAIAYSSLPEWKPLLRQFEPRAPRYDVLSEKYLDGKMATLAQFEVPPSPTAFERMRKRLHLDAVFGRPPHKVILEPSPEVLDILWGYYFATGGYGPIMHIIAMLPLSQDHDDADRLTVGSMAKYSLASNAMRDPALLAMLKSSRRARGQPKKTVAILDDVVDAAETVDTARIRKEALAAIEELRAKGPAYRRNVSWWGYIGQSAIAGGCIAAAVTGQVELGIPCVVGGATASAALNFWNNSPQ